MQVGLMWRLIANYLDLKKEQHFRGQVKWKIVSLNVFLWGRGGIVEWFTFIDSAVSRTDGKMNVFI